MVVLMKICAVIVIAGGLLRGNPADETSKPDKVVSITAERFVFSPSRIKVKQGTVVEFVIRSDDTDHGFRIPAANIDVAVPQQGRGEVRVRFVAKEKGSFQFECSRPCGAGHNLMRGRIIVE
jgi:cytochrome c oxidase subunit II